MGDLNFLIFKEIPSRLTFLMSLRSPATIYSPTVEKFSRIFRNSSERWAYSGCTTKFSRIIQYKIDLLAFVFIRLHKTIIRPHTLFFASLSTDGIILFTHAFFNIDSSMFQMNCHRAVSNLKRLNSIIYQSFAQLSVFSTILHPFIESVNRNNIRAPSR